MLKMDARNFFEDILGSVTERKSADLFLSNQPLIGAHSGSEIPF